MNLYNDLKSVPDQLAYTGRQMFARRLCDMAGGNVSARAGDDVYISPRYSGSQQHWQLEPTDIVSGLWATDDLLTHPKFSREGRAHLAVYRAFPEVQGIIHAHPFHVLAFCVAERPIEPVLEATQKFGVVDVIRGASAHSPLLAEQIVAGLRGKEASMRKQAAAVLLPRHGIFVAGKDIFAALDALERIDWNAYCIMAQQLIPAQPVAYREPGA